MILTTDLCRQGFFLNFKGGTPSREENKTGFSVLTIIELELMIDLKSAQRQMMILRYALLPSNDCTV
jgi:hypothetical protein